MIIANPLWHHYLNEKTSLSVLKSVGGMYGARGTLGSPTNEGRCSTGLVPVQAISCWCCQVAKVEQLRLALPGKLVTKFALIFPGSRGTIQ